MVYYLKFLSIGKIKAVLKGKFKMEKNCLDFINNAVNNFQITGVPRGCMPYGNGHINDSFRLVCDQPDGSESAYIIQAVNNSIFKNPRQVMENIEKVTAHLRKKATDPREVLQLVPTHNGNSYYIDKNKKCWRVYRFIENSLCIERPERTDDFYECGIAFGKFQRDLSDFPADELYEVLPKFHDTAKRYRDFQKAVKEDAVGRAHGVLKEIAFINERADFYGLLADAHKNGELPLRVSHNDTKTNNAMLDATTRKALCVIDLDTIMPGFSVTDFGDAIRFGASTAAEDEKDLSKVGMNLGMFTAFADGFLTGCDGQLEDSEIMLMPEGAKMMTIECAMRFLADYLSGDTYFKIKYPEHNLDRCRTQLKLVADMERNWEAMKQIVSKYCKNR